MAKGRFEALGPGFEFISQTNGVLPVRFEAEYIMMCQFRSVPMLN